MIPTSVPILRIGRVLIASFQTELKDTVVDAFQQEVLTQIQGAGAKGLVIDISTVEMVDTYTARVIMRTGRMAKLLGTDTVLSGVRPEIAATLVRMGFLLPEVKTALDLEESLRLLGVISKAA